MTRPRRWPGRWIGRWIMVVAALHLLAALLSFGDVLAELLHIMPVLEPNNRQRAAYWFVAAAPILGTLGLLIDSAEACDVAIPAGVPIILLVTLAWMLATVPVNGGWLLLPPVIALLLRARQSRQ